MRHALTLAAIPVPLLMWAAWPASHEHPIAVMAVATEGVRAQRQDTETFRARWQPVYLPPMRAEMRAIGASVAGPRGETRSSANRGDGSMFAPAIRYQLPAAMPAADETLAGGPRESTPTRQPSPRIVRRAALRSDVCARHGLRRVTYTRGKWQGWRCRP